MSDDQSSTDHTDARTVLLGMNNPLSDDDRHALAPHPRNFAGWRLWRVLWDVEDVRRVDYMRTFDRRNVLHAREWSTRAARVAGESLWSTLRGRRVVILGAATLAAVAAPRLPAGAWGVWRGFSYVCLPHPSGRCREYNDPDARRRAGELLRDEYARSRAILTDHPDFYSRLAQVRETSRDEAKRHLYSSMHSGDDDGHQ